MYLVFYGPKAVNNVMDEDPSHPKWDFLYISNLTNLIWPRFARLRGLLLSTMGLAPTGPTGLAPTDPTVVPTGPTGLANNFGGGAMGPFHG